VGVEQQVAGLEVGTHVLQTRPFAELAQIGHLDAIVRADVDGAKERRLSHAGILATLRGFSSQGCQYTQTTS
jgi:hypothetical protein